MRRAFNPFPSITRQSFPDLSEAMARGRAERDKTLPDTSLPLIITDTREQNPLAFGIHPTEFRCLQTGDYSLEGWEENGITIERKSKGDIVGSLTAGRDRFKREIERMRAFESAHLVLEATEAELAAGEYRSAMNPHALIQSIRAIGARGICVWYAGSHAAAALLVLDLFRHYVRIKAEDAAAASAAAMEHPPAE